jgi:GMP synthase (glutamine-hydrolysing)
MSVLAVVHGASVPAGVFGDEAERRGHRVDEWSLAWGTPPPLPVDEYDAVMLFGGSMHADQDDRHPWLREENLLIQRLLDQHVPLFGVCLGAQLIAKAAHAPVRGPSSGGRLVRRHPQRRSGGRRCSRRSAGVPLIQWHSTSSARRPVPSNCRPPLLAGVPARRHRLGRAVPRR